MRHNGDQSTNDQRLTVPEAAEALGISPEAVRARIHRGTLRKEKAPDGTVYVRLNGDRSQPNGDDTRDKTHDRSAVGQLLREQVAQLREKLDHESYSNRKNQRIIAGLVQRLPELEAPRNGHETATVEPDREQHRPSTEGPQEGTGRRSWWRTWFGF